MVASQASPTTSGRYAARANAIRDFDTRVHGSRKRLRFKPAFRERAVVEPHNANVVGDEGNPVLDHMLIEA